MHLTYYGAKKNGKLVLDCPGVFARNLQKIQEDKRLQLTLEYQQHDPTKEQFAYLHGCVYKPLVGEHFDTMREADEYFKKAFNVKWRFPEDFPIEKAKLNRQWLGRFIEFCVQHAAEVFSYVAPEPPIKEKSHE